MAESDKARTERRGAVSPSRAERGEALSAEAGNLLDYTHSIPSVALIWDIVFHNSYLSFFAVANMDFFRPVTQNIGFHNARYKYYPTPDGGRRLVEIMAFSEPVYNPQSLERVAPPRKKMPSADDPSADAEDEIKQNECSENKKERSDYAVRRARRRLYDLVACNPDCNMMVTLTLNGEDFARDEWSAIIPKLSTWLDNATRRRGMKYILVPEHHKDGKSIHFHGFINEGALALSRAINPRTGKPIKQNGRAVYNVDNWKYGFTTAVRVGKSDLDQSSSAKYVLKYITKCSDKIGGRYYLHGGALAEPIFEYYDVDFEKLGGEEKRGGENWTEFSILERWRCKLCRDFQSGTASSVNDGAEPENKWEIL